MLYSFEKEGVIQMDKNIGSTDGEEEILLRQEYLDVNGEVAFVLEFGRGVPSPTAENQFVIRCAEMPTVQVGDQTMTIEDLAKKNVARNLRSQTNRRSTKRDKVGDRVTIHVPV